MNILVINAGSSSLKYQLFNMDDQSVTAKGLFERIGIGGPPDHSAAVQSLIERLTDPKDGVIKTISEISAVGHRVLHGGEKFSASVLVTEAVIAAVEEVVPLGPLHNPANLVGIRACQKIMGANVPQVAVFDTAFHQTMPAKAFMYAVPYEYYTENHVRRYGFHGTSHRFVSARAAAFLGKKPEELRIVTCHLGNGSSLAAVAYGKCVDTTMGLTPLEGVPMGTRSGSIDPAIIEYICNSRGLTVTEVTSALNKKSGVLGLSGVSSDFRDLHGAADGGNERAALALDHFTYNVRKRVAEMAAAMGGVDALAFTAGVGENDGRTREAVCGGLEFIGLSLDRDKNAAHRGEGDVSAPGSKARVLVIPTNEELVIALDTYQLTVDN
ncbi:acetate kinase [Clostridia bacterium]|nr:acetate kinase [Clostridia bacterium]